MKCCNNSSPSLLYAGLLETIYLAGLITEQKTVCFSNLVSELSWLSGEPVNTRASPRVVTEPQCAAENV